jgi:hypothetical protein
MQLARDCRFANWRLDLANWLVASGLLTLTVEVEHKDFLQKTKIMFVGTRLDVKKVEPNLNQANSTFPKSSKYFCKSDLETEARLAVCKSDVVARIGCWRLQVASRLQLANRMLEIANCVTIAACESDVGGCKLHDDCSSRIGLPYCVTIANWLEIARCACR